MAIKVYNVSQHTSPFGIEVGSTGWWLWDKNAAGVWDPKTMVETVDYSLLWWQVNNSDHLMFIDEYNLPLNDWVTGLQTLRNAYQKAGYPSKSLKFMLYDFPNTPFDNAIAAKSSWYDGWLKNQDNLVKHPLAKQMWAYCPSFYRVDANQTIEAWNANIDLILPVCHRVAVAMDKPLVPVLSPVPALIGSSPNAGMCTPEIFSQMLDRMKREGLDCSVWMIPNQQGNDEIAKTIRNFKY